jgi:hypothetical protein
MSAAGHIALTILLVAQGGLAGEIHSNASDEADTSFQRGLVLNAQYSPFYSSAQSFKSGEYAFSLGAGYCIGYHFSIGLNIYTGGQTIPAEEFKPISGRLSLGGGGIEVTFIPVAAGDVRPYVTIGYGLFTLLSTDGLRAGYNGGGLQAGAGAQFEFSRYFSSQAGLRFGCIRYHSRVPGLVGDFAFVPYNETELGVILRVNFYPRVFP